MSVALIYPKSTKGGRGNKCLFLEQFSKNRLSYARTILKHAADLSDAVLDGLISLDAAYKEVQCYDHSHTGTDSALKNSTANLDIYV
jgi:hypothetical protein